MNRFSRRDILKLAGALAGTGALKGLAPSISPANTARAGLPNIIILVFDAMSAKNLSLYGYPRRTSPNFERFAERAVVFHNHYANGSFTSPGTASLLTGQRPWTHRAFNPSGVVRTDLAGRNIFDMLGDEYFRMAFTQNLWADYLLNQFSTGIDAHLPISAFDIIGDGFIDRRVQSDSLVAYRSYASSLFPWTTKNPTSLVLSFLYNVINTARSERLTSPDFPHGLPANNTIDAYRLEDVLAGILDEITSLEDRQVPYLSYFHLWPPHDPYKPRQDFASLFNRDGYVPVEKKEHPLSADFSASGLSVRRIPYDNYIAYVDSEFGKLMDSLDRQGVLDHSYLFVVSDHGEMFERGVRGHFTPLLYEPIIRVPLMVSVPGVRTRTDIHTPTNNIDVLPTLLHIAGREIPSWCEGGVLPGLGGREDPGRSLIVMDAKDNYVDRPFVTATYAILKNGYKLIRYRGYKGRYKDHFEFYNLNDDPEELHDRMGKPKYAGIVADLQAELQQAEQTANDGLP